MVRRAPHSEPAKIRTAQPEAREARGFPGGDALLRAEPCAAAARDACAGQGVRPGYPEVLFSGRCTYEGEGSSIFRF